MLSKQWNKNAGYWPDVYQKVHLGGLCGSGRTMDLCGFTKDHVVLVVRDKSGTNDFSQMYSLTVPQGKVHTRSDSVDAFKECILTRLRSAGHWREKPNPRLLHMDRSLQVSTTEQLHHIELAVKVVQEDPVVPKVKRKRLVDRFGGSKDSSGFVAWTYRARVRSDELNINPVLLKKLPNSIAPGVFAMCTL
jgi:hypothetical protein